MEDGARRGPERFVMIRCGLSLKSRQNLWRICETQGPTSNGPQHIGFLPLKVKKKMDPSDINRDITSLFTDSYSVKTCD